LGGNVSICLKSVWPTKQAQTHNNTSDHEMMNTVCFVSLGLVKLGNYVILKVLDFYFNLHVHRISFMFLKIQKIIIK